MYIVCVHIYMNKFTNIYYIYICTAVTVSDAATISLYIFS